MRSYFDNFNSNLALNVLNTKYQQHTRINIINRRVSILFVYFNGINSLKLCAKIVLREGEKLW